MMKIMPIMKIMDVPDSMICSIVGQGMIIRIIALSKTIIAPKAKENVAGIVVNILVKQPQNHLG